jgi:hypothetical protein
MEVLKTPKCGICRTKGRGQIAHTEFFRIGNRSDALDLLKGIEDTTRREDLPFVISAVEIIREAIERGIL